MSGLIQRGRYPVPETLSQRNGIIVQMRASVPISVNGLKTACSQCNLVELCLPFARTGGCFLAMKGPKAEEEVPAATNAFKILGGKMSVTTSITLPILNDLRSLVRIGKIASTPRAYPRKPGIPERQPL